MYETIEAITAFPKDFIPILQKLDAIQKGQVTMSETLQALDQKIDEVATDVATIKAAATTLATEYGKISTDIKNMLIELQNGKPVNFAAELAKLEAADASIKEATSVIDGVTTQAEADDQSVNPGGPSNFGEIPSK